MKNQEKSIFSKHIFIITKNIIVFNIILLILMTIGCSSISVNENEVVGNNFEIRNDEFLNLILQAKKDFKKKYNQSTEIIVVNFFGESDLKVVNIISKSHLYFNLDEKKIINEKFEGISKINGTTILLKNYNKHKRLNLFNFNIEKEIYKVKFGSFMNICINEFSYDKGFVLTDNFCSPDW